MSDGAFASGSSGVNAYSPSNPMMIRPNPSAPPRTCRLAGVVLAPMNPVISARAGAAMAAVNRSAPIHETSRGMKPPLWHHNGIRDSGFGIRDSGFGIRDSGFEGFAIRDSLERHQARRFDRDDPHADVARRVHL